LKLLVRLLVGLALLLVLAVAGVCLWMLKPYPQDQASIEDALASDQLVRVSQGEFLVLEPASRSASTALIFYPGGKVDPIAYAPILRDLAGNGLKVVVTPMPLKTAFLGVERANDAVAAFPEIERWFLAGHSLGGVAASRYAEQFDKELSGLIFWASYPVVDLSSQELPVLSIYALGDFQTTLEDIEQSRALLPAPAKMVAIEGNHWQFGEFSSGLHQAPPKVTRQEQQAEIVAATLEFVNTPGS